ncbi:MAG: hypothetical protein GF393_10810 [Armatimonadia bacterium]|nr:hypothetical protein [Armatimonadia bacterium]
MRSLLIALAAIVIAMPAFAQRPSNVTRGVYVHSRDLVPSYLWAQWGSGFDFVTDNPHSGEMCIKATNEPGGRGAGCTQQVQINQDEPAPIKIAGWSRAEGVESTGKPYQYSIYVDLRYADGEPWYMQIAPFEPGTHDWQYSETILEPEKPVATASVSIFVRDIGGTAWFDDVFFGPVDGENLLDLGGFEARNMADTSRRDKVIGDLEAMNCNMIHTYMSVPDDEDADRQMREMLGVLEERGIGVTLTPHVPYGTFEDADDPAFPSYYCVNNDWGDRWVGAYGELAQYPFMGISVVPDEYNWNTGRLVRRYTDHPDERVQQFYEQLPTYCPCPKCQERFEAEHGMPLPEMGEWSRPPEQSEAYRNFIDFRYQCTTDLIGRAVDAVHSGPYETAADSLICVSPICSDFRLGTGVAWDMVGYETDIDFPTTDPYILLHNYKGDSTHWYVTETAMHLAGSTPKRQCGVVLEAGHLRADHRPLLPVEIYGSALSSVARGAKEIGFFHYVHLMQQTEAGKTQGDSAFDAVKGCYELLERIDPWLEGAEPVRRVALLYSRASDEYFSFYTHPEPNMDVLTHETDDPRYPFLAQKEVLYYLLRAGVPTDLYYLDTVREEELAEYQAIVVPFPFAVSEEQAAVLEELVQAGKGLFVFSEFGSVDEKGVPHERPVLVDLLGLAEAPSGQKTGRMEVLSSFHPKDGEFTVYDTVLPMEDTETVAMVEGTSALTLHPFGDGGTFFLAGEFGIDLPENYDNEQRDRTVRIMPSELSRGHARLLGEIFDELALTERLVPEDDVELSLMRNAAGDLLLFAINWEEHPVTVDVALPDAGTGTGFSLAAAGTLTERSVDSDSTKLDLAPQEALVVRFAAE